MNKILMFLCAACVLSAANIYASFEARPLHEAKLAFSAVGVVNSVNVSLGDKVSKDQVLATLDASVEKANVNAAMAALRLANSKLNRIKTAGSALSKSTLDEANAAQSVASAQLELSKAALALKTLKAPFDGIIAAKMCEVGDGVAGPAQPVFVLQNNSALELMIFFDVAYKQQVKIGDEFEFMIDNKPIKVQISAISPSASLIDRKVQAKALYTGDGLVAGSYGEGYILKN